MADASNFAYTGSIQTFTVPVSGIYKLTVVGANGAYYLYDTPHGGRSVGYKELKKGDVLYVCCGQAGAFDGKAAYNGGGAGIVPTGGNHNWRNPSGSGGGATHIALVTGTLAEIGEDNQDKVLIVAGGAGGESGHTGSGAFGTYDSEGGSGGGNSGGKGGTNNGTFTPAVPGTQTSGYGFGQGQKATVSVVWDEDNLCAGAGGGGLWGGYAGTNHASGGAGGSGYIGGVPSIVYKGTTYTPSTENNYNTAGTNGYATIELVVKTTLPVIFNGTTLESIIFNGIEITGLIVDGTQLFFERLKRRIAAWFTSTKTALYWKALT
ncbi:MAG: hypothetical protein IJ313_01205 [Clostridia bacterium]|nr:hypothetical protein [Clostridia bacterium]